MSLVSLSGCSQTQAPHLEPPSGLAKVALSQPDIPWELTTAAGYTTYVRRGTYAATHRVRLHERSGEALRHALGILGEPTYPAHLRVFYVSSRDEMLPISGARHTGTTDVEAHAVLLVENEGWRAFARHEVMHAVSLSLWGEPGGVPGTPTDGSNAEAWRRGGWLREGLAAAAEDRCGPYRNRGAAATMQTEGVIIAWATLINSFYEQDDLIAYLQAGSVVEYLLEHYGRDRFLVLWRSGAITEAYGISVESIESEWTAWLRSTPVELRPVSTAALRRTGCG